MKAAYRQLNDCREALDNPPPLVVSREKNDVDAAAPRAGRTRLDGLCLRPATMPIADSIAAAAQPLRAVVWRKQRRD